MKEDAIFSIRSMTKPVTCVAALILVDNGRLGLDDPIHKYFPAFRDIKVRTARETRVAPNRPPTIRDLLRYTDGLPYKRLLDAKAPSSYEEWIEQLVSADLDYHPGTGARYGLSLVVLGGVIRKISGQKLGEFMQDRIFGPLDMRDTAYFVPQHKHDRLATIYRQKDGQLVPVNVREVPNKLSNKGGEGHAGLYSTGRDYARFCQMLLNGGTLGGTRILKEDIVAEMSSNQLPSGVSLRFAGAPGLKYSSFGFGVSVSSVEYGDERNGDYGWGGGDSTFFTVAPSKELVVVFLAQLNPYDGSIYDAVRPQVFAALRD
jgi:CubicO group peptidase (beta-lactamase class C family)